MLGAGAARLVRPAMIRPGLRTFLGSLVMAR